MGQLVKFEVGSSKLCSRRGYWYKLVLGSLDLPAFSHGDNIIINSQRFEMITPTQGFVRGNNEQT